MSPMVTVGCYHSPFPHFLHFLRTSLQIPHPAVLLPNMLRVATPPPRRAPR
jgi:hypothetical protein